MSQTKPNWAGKKCKNCRYHTDCYIRKISGAIEDQNENACGSYSEGTVETKLLHPDIPGYDVIEIKRLNYSGCAICAFGPYCTHPNKDGKKSCMDSPRAFYTKRLDFSEPQKDTHAGSADTEVEQK